MSLVSFTVGIETFKSSWDEGLIGFSLETIRETVGEKIRETIKEIVKEKSDKQSEKHSVIVNDSNSHGHFS